MINPKRPRAADITKHNKKNTVESCPLMVHSIIMEHTPN